MFFTNKDIEMITGARQNFLLRLNVHRKLKHSGQSLNPTQALSLTTCLLRLLLLSRFSRARLCATP